MIILLNPQLSIQTYRKNERNIVLMMALKQRAEKHYSSIKLPWAGKYVSHFCPFSGGGDIYMLAKEISACLRLSDSDDDVLTE